MKITMLATGLARACAIAALGLMPTMAWAEDPVVQKRPTHNLFGITGLMDLPSADMQPDGQFTTTASYFAGYLRNTISAQFLPGLEVAFRYSILEDLSPGRADLFDRSFDAKIRILQESDRWPAIAVGLQDFLGTGVFSSEYLVATKGIQTADFGDFRFTGGFGWGRYATQNGVRNPLSVVDSFSTRAPRTDLGGNVNLGRYFSGEDVGLFGGVEWQTPIEDLTVKVEYSPDRYDREREFGDFEQNVPINAGIEYRPLDGIEIGAYYMYGSEVGVRLSISGNPFRPILDQDLEPGPQPLRQRPPVENEQLAALGAIADMITGSAPVGQFSDKRLNTVIVHTRLGTVRWAEATLNDGVEAVCPEDLATAIDAEYGVVDVVTFTKANGNVLCTLALRPAGQHAIRMTSRVHASYPTDWYGQPEQRQQLVEILSEELSAERIGLLGIEIAPRRVEVFIANRKWRATPRAMGRTARALARTMPASVEIFEITPVERSLPVSTIVLQRSQLEEQVDRPDAAERSWATATLKNADPVPWSELASADEGLYPKFTWNISPSIPVSLFDPDNPARFDLGVNLGGGIEFMPGLSVNAEVTTRIIGTLDEITRESDSVVERVRSDFATYLREGNPALTRLTVDYITKLTSSLYGKATAGIFERQYAGVGAELLWKPATQDWGIGADLNFVRQRGFSQLFDLRDYETLTGHATLYWDTQFYGLNLQLDGGRYLAGDWGGTIGLRRRFPNGWEFGGFATFTTIGFDEFGEGSFDKGIFLTIPFNWALPYESRSEFSTVVRPLTRDGGQRVRVPGKLYPTVEDHDQGDYRRTWEDFWE